MIRKNKSLVIETEEQFQWFSDEMAGVMNVLGWNTLDDKKTSAKSKVVWKI